jgi:C4-dicarboxylate-specific signal transduction histidine kinase
VTDQDDRCFLASFVIGSSPVGECLPLRPIPGFQLTAPADNRSMQPSRKDRTHPDDRVHLRQVIERVTLERCSFSAEHRLRMPNGLVKHVRVVARRATSEDPERVLFIGAVTDITERKLAEQQRERLRQLEGDLAHINRVSTMGELAASLAHEIKQPITAVATNAGAVLRWLHREPPEIERACQNASRIIDATDRAVHIVDRNRASTAARRRSGS